MEPANKNLQRKVKGVRKKISEASKGITKLATVSMIVAPAEEDMEF